ncbi:hypothetical protein DENSPDRAFT_830955 [Dentipellis sp. KUC8613]|nr:hypothetical protein DENSPDRAFT_830955 [Dentipellis sp. KUC8613]
MYARTFSCKTLTDNSYMLTPFIQPASTGGSGSYGCWAGVRHSARGRVVLVQCPPQGI